MGRSLKYSNRDCIPDESPRGLRIQESDSPVEHDTSQHHFLCDTCYHLSNEELSNGVILRCLALTEESKKLATGSIDSALLSVLEDRSGHVYKAAQKHLVRHCLDTESIVFLTMYCMRVPQ